MPTPSQPPRDPDDSGVVRQGVRYVGVLHWTDDVGEHRLEIVEPSILGSSERAQVRVQHAGISRLQAELSPGPDGVEILDLKSGRKTRYKNLVIGRVAVIPQTEVLFGDVPMRIAFEQREERRYVSAERAGSSDLWNDLWDRAWDLGHRNEPMVIRGPEGASFDFFAERVHDAGARADRPFVSVDCWHEDDLESLAELIATRAGVVDWKPGDVPDKTLDVSRAGTLYLRRAQWLKTQAQRDLLNWLRGGPDACDIGLPRDARVIVSSDEPLACRLNSGFSEALYFEITRLSLQIPQLRHRLGDVPAMVHAIAAERGVTKVPEELMAQALEWAHSMEDGALMGMVNEMLGGLQ